MFVGPHGVCTSHSRLSAARFTIWRMNWGRSCSTAANRNLTLTPAGESFLKEARQILSHVVRAAQLAQAASRGEAGQLSIAILPPIGGLFLPPAIRAFRERFAVVD